VMMLSTLAWKVNSAQGWRFDVRRALGAMKWILHLKTLEHKRKGTPIAEEEGEVTKKINFIASADGCMQSQHVLEANIGTSSCMISSPCTRDLMRTGYYCTTGLWCGAPS
jgi:hypothetical protein